MAAGFLSSSARATRRDTGSTFASLCLTVVQLGLLASHAVADASHHVRLRYDAPAGCPQSTDILRAIDAQLGAGFSTDTVLSARASVTKLGEGDYEVSIDYEAGGGVRERRRMHAESCAAAGDATALVLAIALSPAEAAQPAPSPAAEREPASSSSTTYSLGVLALVDSALLPSPALAGSVRVGLGLGPLQLAVSAALFVPQTLSEAGVTVELEQWAVDVGACYLTELGGLQLGPCVRFELGRQIAEPSGDLAGARLGGARFQSLGLGAELRLPVIGPWWLVVQGGAEWIARRPQFVVTGTGTLASPSLFGARLDVGALLVW